MRNFFNFFRTPANRGVGTGNQALIQPQTVPINSMYGPRYNVHKSFAVTYPGYFLASKSVPFISIEGNGSSLNGQFALQSLIERTKGGNS